MTNQTDQYQSRVGSSLIQLVYIVTVIGYEFSECHPLDEGMDESSESLWRQAIKHSHFHTDDEDQIDEWIKEGLEEGFVDLDSGYRIEEPWITKNG